MKYQKHLLPALLFCIIFSSRMHHADELATTTTTVVDADTNTSITVRIKNMIPEKIQIHGHRTYNAVGAKLGQIHPKLGFGDLHHTNMALQKIGTKDFDPSAAKKVFNKLDLAEKNRALQIVSGRLTDKVADQNNQFEAQLNDPKIPTQLFNMITDHEILTIGNSGLIQIHDLRQASPQARMSVLQQYLDNPTDAKLLQNAQKLLNTDFFESLTQEQKQNLIPKFMSLVSLARNSSEIVFFTKNILEPFKKTHSVQELVKDIIKEWFHAQPQSQEANLLQDIVPTLLDMYPDEDITYFFNKIQPLSQDNYARLRSILPENKYQFAAIGQGHNAKVIIINIHNPVMLQQDIVPVIKQLILDPSTNADLILKIAQQQARIKNWSNILLFLDSDTRAQITAMKQQQINTNAKN